MTTISSSYVHHRIPPFPGFYARPMPDLTIPRVGNGPKKSAMWLDGVPCIVKGFHEWPKVGERHLIDGLLYRLVEISDRWLWKREAS